MQTSCQCMVMNQPYGILTYLLLLGKIIICVKHNIMSLLSLFVIKIILELLVTMRKLFEMTKCLGIKYILCAGYAPPNL